MIRRLIIIIYLINAVLLFPWTGAIQTFNVVDFGARSDENTDSSDAFVKAWNAACNTPVSSQVTVPANSNFLVKRGIRFSGTCKSHITLSISGGLVAPIDDYGSSESGDSWFTFDNIDGLFITGGGTLDGRGKNFWDCKARGEKSCNVGSRTIALEGCRNVRIQNIKSVNSAGYHMTVNGCQQVMISGVTLVAPGDSPNTDGIHIERSSHLSIAGSMFKTGDDCISIGQGTHDLLVHDVFCGPGHGISIGSLGHYDDEEYVSDVTVQRVTFDRTDNGFRIKSYATPYKSYVQGVRFEDATMHDVRNPIIIDQNYCPQGGCPRGDSGVKIRDVTFNNIQGRSASLVAMKFDCSAQYPCSELKLEGIQLTYPMQEAQSFCANAHGSASGIVEPRSCL